LNAVPLVDAIVQFLGDRGVLAAADVREALERELTTRNGRDVAALKSHLTSDDGWAYYPPDALARRIHHVLAHRVVTDDSELIGSDGLAAVAGAPVVIVSNHLSYSDANVIDVMLHRFGATEVADRLTALAGPKVFTSRERRFSSLCFGTIKVPQSTEVSSGEAVLKARDVARAARRAIEVAHERLAAGDALILFGEGTRSRDGRMQRMLPAAARYLEGPPAWVLPVGLTGPEALFPIDGARLQPTRITMTVGRAIRSEALLAPAKGNRRAVMDRLGLAIAQLLPAEYRGVYSAA
jgi:1-acyl-sn-glycerol-3-phosphate acyltransferase